MGDRSYMAITVYACPADKRDLLHQVITGTLDLQVQEDHETLVLGEQYSVEETLLGTDDELYAAIREQVGLDGLTFDLQQEPKYEYDGFRHMQVAGLGLHHSAVSNSGNIVLGYDGDIAPLFTSDATVESVREGLRKVFGVPWQDALSAYKSSRCKHCHLMLTVEGDTFVDGTGGDVCGTASTETLGENRPHELRVYEEQIEAHNTDGITILDCVLCQTGEPMLHAYEKR